MMKKYRKKPVEIAAVRFHATEPGDPLRFDHIPEWLQDAFDGELLERRNGDAINGGDYDYIAIRTMEGVMIAAPDDYIIRGVKGELYPCKPDIFVETYDEVL